MIRDEARLHELYLIAVEEGLIKSKRREQFYFRTVFAGVDFHGARVLDIGGGSGLLSFYAACMGARQVTCLEPEAEGSSLGVGRIFSAIRDRLGFGDRVVCKPVTFQAFESAGERFDVILLHHSINHLDETACIQLLEREEARTAYRRISAKLGSLSETGTKLILFDCSSRNLFALLGIRNPFAPTIEWRKHHPPEVWASLLEEVGFQKDRVAWMSFSRLYLPGRLLLGNRFASYFLTSHFSLTMTKR